jgi:hypothetical protein
MSNNLSMQLSIRAERSHPNGWLREWMRDLTEYRGWRMTHGRTHSFDTLGEWYMQMMSTLKRKPITQRAALLNKLRWIDRVVSACDESADVLLYSRRLMGLTMNI